MSELRPEPRAAVRHPRDLELARAVLADRAGSWADFLARAGPSIHALAGDAFEAPDAEYIALLERVREHGCRVLREYDGRSRLTAFLRLRLADTLADRVLQLFSREPARAWRAFERFYRPDLVRVIRQCFPDERGGDAPTEALDRDDVYQDVCFLLVEDDYRRIRAYDGRGRFSAYVRRVARNLCTDLRRRVAGRLRLPEALKRASPLEQEAYRLVHWRGISPSAAAETLRSTHSPPASAELTERAVERARALPAPSRLRPVPLEDEVGDARLSPEQLLLEAEARDGQDRVLRRLSGALDGLPAEARLYVRLRFFETPPLPPREIARLMGRTPREIYTLRDRTLAALRRVLEPAGKTGPSSVLP